MKKEIELIFLGMGYNDYFQGNIHIYDNNKNLLLKKKTFNGKVMVCLNQNHYYFIKVFFNGMIINRIIYVNNYQNKYVFVFENVIIKNRIITFLLTDQNYTNLPIEKGKVILWQK